MAHKKAAGTAKNLRDSAGKRLGIKLFGGQKVIIGNIICRQRGTKWRPGVGVRVGRDHTIYAIADGVVKFTIQRRRRFDGRIYTYTVINVVSPTVEPKVAPKKKKATKPVKKDA
jgi:large subunit ribosomal protein L27